MYIDEDLNYTVIEKAPENAFQALWIEIQFPKQANVICGVVTLLNASWSTLTKLWKRLALLVNLSILWAISK